MSESSTQPSSAKSTERKSAREAAPSADLRSPDWPRDALLAFFHELKLFFSTVWSVTRHPQLFGDAWVRGRANALNPIGFVATSAGLVGVAAHLTTLGLRTNESAPPSLIAEVLGQLGPFLHFAAAGALLHILLKLMRSVRGRLRDTVALALFVGGGPVAIVQLVYFAAVLVLVRGYHLNNAALSAHPVFNFELEDDLSGLLWCFAYSLILVLWMYLTRAVEGVHGLRFNSQRVVLAIIVAETVLMAFFGIVDPPGNYGARIVLHPSNSPSAHYGFMIEPRFD